MAAVFSFFCFLRNIVIIIYMIINCSIDFEEFRWYIRSKKINSLINELNVDSADTDIYVIPFNWNFIDSYAKIPMCNYHIIHPQENERENEWQTTATRREKQLKKNTSNNSRLPSSHEQTIARLNDLFVYFVFNSIKMQITFVVFILCSSQECRMLAWLGFGFGLNCPVLPVFKFKLSKILIAFQNACFHV